MSKPTKGVEMSRTTKSNHRQIILAIKWYGSEDVEASVMEFIRTYASKWRQTKHNKY